jgi:hypothetical protein
MLMRTGIVDLRSRIALTNTQRLNLALDLLQRSVLDGRPGSARLDAIQVLEAAMTTPTSTQQEKLACGVCLNTARRLRALGPNRQHTI